METCPRCRRPVEPAARVCVACGVILAKVKARTDESPVGARTDESPVGARPPSPGGDLPLPPPVRASLRPPTFRELSIIKATTVQERVDEHTSPGRAGFRVVLATSAALLAWAGFARMGQQPKPKPEGLVKVPSSVATPDLPAIPLSSAGAEGGLEASDLAFLNEVSSRLRQSPAATPTEAEIERLEGLVSAHQGEGDLKPLLMAVYFRRADHDLQLAAFSKMDLTLTRMKALDSQDVSVYDFETSAKLRQGEWEAALGAAERYESLSGDATVMMSYSRALALAKLGRTSDAVAVLDRPIFQTCPAAATAMDKAACGAAAQMRLSLTASSAPAVRAREALDVDPFKQQIQSETFDVRFDGENQNGVARDVLFVLDRAYVRLANIYYDRPTRKIPVVLHSAQDYYSATGAPWWSGGVFSSHTGAIQIPIRGIPSTLPREMEDVLVHELSHAFVDEMSGGFAGRDLQEGLAQYMEGKRIEQEMSQAELKQLANSKGQGVMNFYMLSLAVTQQLVQSRGQSAINDLLKAMKQTGSQDAGFKKVFGQTGDDMKREILTTFWRRYS